MTRLGSELHKSKTDGMTYEEFEAPIAVAKRILSCLEQVAVRHPGHFTFGGAIFRHIDLVERKCERLGVTFEQLDTSRDRLWWMIAGASCRAFA